MSSRRIPVALTIAGSDSGGGAGIQADLKTFAAMGVHGTSAITSLTAQNTREVRSVHDLPPEFVALQIEVVADDLGVDAAKTGMLSSAPIISAVARTVKRYGFPLVVDPVMIAKSGARLLREDAVEILKRELIPLAKIVTPNRMEAEALLGVKIDSVERAREAAQMLVDVYGCEAAIVKGGHIEGEHAVDILYYRGSFYEFKSLRVQTKNTHGTGCGFSAAIAAGIAKGKNLVDAVSSAKDFITTAIEYGLDVGSGHGPINPAAYIYIPAERYRVLENVERAVELLLKNDRVVAKVVPEVGMNIGMSIDPLYARTPLDVAAIPGRITRYRDGIMVKSKPEFGVSKHIANAILTMIRVYPEYRAAANMAYSEKLVEIAESIGLTTAYFDRREEPESIKLVEGATIKWGIEHTLKRTGKPVDIIYDFGDVGKEPVMRVFGGDAVDVARKIIAIANKQ
ncbi:MAG: bifunctional hydroxymethylpyrimidine kinase/phosphomethylpyrimidine kinase [Ignisphaera sp.]|nr:bifunctional hydroxymethylpyrimidine kinase/phosphomethylpyrimidine kinase [Ignisphaera sp.]MDW8084769.1 bifunctional hydroxymethylpyrimidine kinase/phosphomethylpyrimidine kinase [Ignisphaera sp.]